MNQLKAKILKHSLFAIIICLFWNCHSSKILPRKTHQKLDEFIEQSPVFSKGHTGFMLYDPVNGQSLYQQNASKYFTPASNTKIFTLYTALKILKDTLSICNYQIQNDSLLFWGTGNPLLLHPEFDESDTLISFLQSHPDKQLFYSDHNFQDGRFGAGWMWDDYSGGFQAEKAALPIFGNLAWINTDSNRTISIRPSFFSDRLQYSRELSTKYPRSTRAEMSNDFYYNQKAHQTPDYRRVIPFRYTPQVATQVLRSYIDQRIVPIELDASQISNRQTFTQPLPDTIYKKLMKESDNFIAEQLLLLCSDRLFDTISTQKVIAYAKEHLFSAAPDELLWYDGSGITRYNLFTPRTVVHTLDLLYKEFPRERLFEILAVGGQSGTIRRWYKAPKPYIYAKTGTLRNVHCLSGYLLTKSGKTLIFSFMHNHFNAPSSILKKEMTRVLEFIRDEL